jgi:hypothetical protein
LFERSVPWLWIVVLACAFGAWQSWLRRELHHAPGVLVAEEPEQREIERGEAFEHDGYTIHPLATFRLRARVLSREDYRFDTMSALAPTDLALGWGAMSNSAVLKGIEVSQSSRFYFWHVQQFPIPEREIVSHSANMHLIPADGGVARVLSEVRKGQVIALAGELVEAARPDGWHIRSSLRRDDSGPGACEVIWVQDLRVDSTP